MSFAEEIKPLKLSRGSYKGKITHVLNGLKEYSDAGTLEELFVKKQAAQVTNYLNKIEEIDQKLSEAWDNHEIALDDADRALDVLNSVKHQQDTSVKLSVYEKAVMSSTLAAQNASNKELVSALTQAQATPGRNLIKCERFDGGSSDKFEFKYWLSQFESMLASGKAMSGTSKLSVLRNHLTHSGLAFKTFSFGY